VRRRCCREALRNWSRAANQRAFDSNRIERPLGGAILKPRIVPVSNSCGFDRHVAHDEDTSLSKPSRVITKESPDEGALTHPGRTQIESQRYRNHLHITWAKARWANGVLSAGPDKRVHGATTSHSENFKIGNTPVSRLRLSRSRRHRGVSRWRGIYSGLHYWLRRRAASKFPW
jgi:hypothetical protein